MDSSQEFTIIGGGLAGSLMAIMLGAKGYQVNLYEKRPDMRQRQIDGGRSINLALSHRGLLALEKVGLVTKVKKLLIPMRGRLIHTTSGELNFQPYGKDDSEVINSISRVDLNTLLLEEADKYSNVKLNFNHKCRSYDNRDNTLTIINNKGDEIQIHPQRLIAADGANSAIRRSMLQMGRFDYSQTYMDYGYKELEIPPGEDFKIEPHALHIWPRDRFVMIALPNPDRSFTLTLFAPYTGEHSFETLNTADNIRRFFEKHFPDVVGMMPRLVEDMEENPTGKLVTIRCNPWNKGRAVLIGDAAHAIIPFYGQGMNAAFEDVRILMDLIGQDRPWEEIIEHFSDIRKPDADAIANLSYDNFIEMRDGVADEKFLEQKEIELKLYENYDDVISRYAMVTFHPELGYHEAKTKGDILEKTIQLYQENHESIDDGDLDNIHQEVIRKYQNMDM